MNADIAFHQRIGRLTPLADVLAAIATIEPVSPRTTALAAAAGCVLAADVVAEAARPPYPVAVRDGWAVDSEATRDAGPYAPLTLPSPPQRLDAFDALPSGIDAVAPLDAVSALGSMWQLISPVPPDEGMLPAGGDIEAGTILRRSGLRMRASDIAVLTAAGVVSVSIRQPLIRIVNARPSDAILNSAAALLARAVASTGARISTSGDLDDALRDDGADAILGIGGTGSGRDDSSVIALSRAGTVTCHGIGLAPGETSAFGTANDRPVLLMPGRIDAMLACWLVLGRAMIDRLGGAQHGDTAVRATLRRKVTSSIGIAEVVPLRHDGDGVEPLGSGYLPLRSLARADGWMLVPATSEGYPAGTEIEMRPLP